MTEFFAEKRVVVTGGAGFLGRWVVEQLRRRSCAQVLVPRRTSCDLLRGENIVSLLKEARPEILLHLAAVVDNPIGQGDAAACFYQNVMMSVPLMEAARRHGVKKMVCLGSASSYPQNAPVPHREEDFWSGYPDESRAAYAMAKKMTLVQAQAFRRQYGFDCIYLIPTNLFGPGDNFDPQTSYVIPALIQKFCQAASENDSEVVLWGSGKATRDFLFVEDCARGILLAVEHYSGKDPVNLGSGRELGIGELAQCIARVVGYSGRILWDLSKADGPPQRRLDVSRAEREFGFRARKDFLEALRETVAWYQATLFSAQQRDRGEVYAQRT